MGELKGEPFNVLIALAMGAAVRDGRVIAPPARLGATTEVSPGVLSELLAAGFVSPEGDSVHITGEGRRALQRTLKEAAESAATWPMIDFDGVDGR